MPVNVSFLALECEATTTHKAVQFSPRRSNFLSAIIQHPWSLFTRPSTHVVVQSSFAYNFVEATARRSYISLEDVKRHSSQHVVRLQHWRLCRYRSFDREDY